MYEKKLHIFVCHVQHWISVLLLNVVIVAAIILKTSMETNGFHSDSLVPTFVFASSLPQTHPAHLLALFPSSQCSCCFPLNSMLVFKHTDDSVLLICSSFECIV